MSIGGMMFVDENLKKALADAEEFEASGELEELLCLKEVRGTGVKAATFKNALDALSSLLTAEESGFYVSFFNRHSVARCPLPKGHKGKCSKDYSRYFDKKIANKLKDCDTTPGDDDILFKNRARRFFPIQVTKSNYVNLNSIYKWKASKQKLKAAIPVEHGGTGFTTASAHFDFSALMTLQKGIVHSLPNEIERVLTSRASVIVANLASRGVYVTDKEGYLCDAVLGYTLELDWYSIDDLASPFQIQFGHVDPLRPDKYMTRGMNVIPITRRGNLIQSDSELSQVHKYLKDAYEHTAPR